MSEEDQCKNILVLGKSNKTISRFVKLFTIYVESKGCKEFLKWTVQKRWTGITTPIDLKKDNKVLKLVPNPLESFKIVLTNLQKFIKPQPVDAVIILLEDDIEMFQLFKERCYPELKKLPTLFVKFDNITKKILDLLSIYYLSDENLFSVKVPSGMQCNDVQHWIEAMDTCKNMFHYIINDTRRSELYFAIEQNPKLLLNLIDKLLDITLEIYLLSNYYEASVEDEGMKLLWTIKYYKKNVTVCCHEDCATLLCPATNLFMKEPLICHRFCNCNETDVAKCMIFDNAAKTCEKCSHGEDSHSKYMYIIDWKWKKTNVAPDKTFALDVLATFCSYIKQNDRPCDLEKLLFKKLLYQNIEQKSIYEKAKMEFKNKLKAMDGTITIIDVVNTIRKLYDLNGKITSIIPEFVEENFPKEFRLQISEGHTDTDTSGLTNELGALKKDVEEIKVVVDQIKVAQDKILNALSALDAKINKELVNSERLLEGKSKKRKADAN